ncbi:hypothetical protein GCM10020216_057940 [Nonomuraea helvata]
MSSPAYTAPNDLIDFRDGMQDLGLWRGHWWLTCTGGVGLHGSAAMNLPIAIVVISVILAVVVIITTFIARPRK